MLSLSDNDEKGKFFPDKGELNFDTASLFWSSSKSLMLNEIFSFSKFNSEIAASILSPPTNLEGLASDDDTAICDFLITKLISLPSGWTTKPLLSDERTLTVTVLFTFLSLKKSNGSFWVCFNLP